MITETDIETFLGIVDGDVDFIVNRPYGTLSALTVETFLLNRLNLKKFKNRSSIGFTGVTLEPWDGGSKIRVTVDFTADGNKSLGYHKIPAALSSIVETFRTELENG